MFLETPNGLINLNNFDWVGIREGADWDKYEWLLVAEKQVGGNGESFAAYSTKALCGGSEGHCHDMFRLIVDGLAGEAWLLTVINGETKPEPENRPKP